jgi:hypothetical protein
MGVAGPEATSLMMCSELVDAPSNKPLKLSIGRGRPLAA